MIEKLKSYPRLNNHGAECKGHSVWMLDNTFEDREDRDILIKALDNAIGKEK